MAQETAVDWLVQELKSKGHALITSEGIFINVPNELIEQAKAMEKEQIKDAHTNGQAEFDTEAFRQKVVDNAEQYYNETYKK